jgi:hypothetical protein
MTNQPMTDFKVYKRKIHVYREGNALDQVNGEMSQWVYAYSTNAYKTCRDAVAAAVVRSGSCKRFTANFAKD